MTLGLTVPLASVALREQYRTMEPLLRAGVTELWSSETAEFDAFGPLISITGQGPVERVGTAIAGIHLRGPALLAMEIASLCHAVGDSTDVSVGLGVGSEAIVQRWNGMPFGQHLARTEAVARFLRAALAGEKVSSEVLGVSGFQLAAPPPPRPIRLLFAALRPRMMDLAVAHADGIITNWLTADDMAMVGKHLRGAGAADGFDVVVRVPVFLCDDPAPHFDKLRRSVTTYLNVPTYAKFQEWLGNGDALGDMWSRWQAGDRKAALDAVPLDLASRILVVGDEQTVATQLDAFTANGATSVVPSLLPWGPLDEQIERLTSVVATLREPAAEAG